jgi:hypothetical protein
MKRAALYARVSTPDQNVETRLYDPRKLAARRDFEVSGEYWVLRHRAYIRSRRNCTKTGGVIAGEYGLGRLGRVNLRRRNGCHNRAPESGPK